MTQAYGRPDKLCCVCSSLYCAVSVSTSCSEGPSDLSLTACLRRLVDPHTGKPPCRERLLAEVGNQVRYGGKRLAVQRR